LNTGGGVNDDMVETMVRPGEQQNYPLMGIKIIFAT